MKIIYPLMKFLKIAKEKGFTSDHESKLDIGGYDMLINLQYYQHYVWHLKFKFQIIIIFKEYQILKLKILILPKN